MALRIELNIGDVTRIAEGTMPPAESVPNRRFSIQVEPTQGINLSFDGNSVLIEADHVRQLLHVVSYYGLTDWRHSRDESVRSIFTPLSRILNVIDSTPSYQLFLAGFHITDTIGFYDLAQVQEAAVIDSFNYLVGRIRWRAGKSGRLFILPEGYVHNKTARMELLANGKLFSAALWQVTVAGDHSVGEDDKLVVPYATPIGFNTTISDDTKSVWQRINHLVSSQ